jgi:hypothetical protein
VSWPFDLEYAVVELEASIAETEPGQTEDFAKDLSELRQQR